jgi:transcriptional regulator with AAA-type ATPase domain/tetratricopeptide (TPR) repeat protein
LEFAPELNELEHLIASGKLETAREKYVSLADRIEASGRDEYRLGLEFLRAQILATGDDYKAATELGSSLLERFRDLNQREKAAQCHLLLSGLLLRTGDYEGAKAHAEAVVYFTTWELDDKALKGDAHNNLGLALKDLGVWKEAERHFREAADSFAGLEDGVRHLRASLNLAILLRKMGKIGDACQICEQGFRKSRELNVPIGVCRYGLELANIAVIERDADRAQEYLRVARQVADKHGYQREKILALEIGGDVLVITGRPEEALETYMNGLELARMLVKDGDLECELLRRAAVVCREMGRAEDGRDLIHQAIGLSEKSQEAYEHGICLRILGNLEIMQGLEGSGIAHLQESVRELSGLSPWGHELALSEFALGEALLKRNRSGTAAIQHLLDARRIYSNLGVSSAIRKLDDLIFSSGALSVGAVQGDDAAHIDARAFLDSSLDTEQYGLVTEDERIVGDLERWGPTEARVLIEGETGVGKELMARALHAMSRRREGPFVAVDCGALSETLADSELFGHSKGAFTGAIRGRTGLIEAANGGTLFLDEIGELPEILQVKLLRVLENCVVRRVGENDPRQVDVRVISATAKDLWAEVEAGRFRRDLYYRLKTVLIRVPSLRERPHDIEMLVDFYMQVYSERHAVTAELDDGARKKFVRYKWPGNVRELKNVVEALILSQRNGHAIDGDRVVEFLSGRGTDSGLKDRIADLEREEIERVMKVCEGNKTKAARMLGISRKTLWQKLKDMSS